MRKRINQLKTSTKINVNSFFFIVILFSFELTMNYQFDFDVQIWTFKNLAKTTIIINIETFVKKFINDKYVKKYQISTLSITKKINFKLIDNFIEHALTKITIIKIRLRNHVNEILCLITSLKKFDLILDMF